jgi:hypothetical protein
MRAPIAVLDVTNSVPVGDARAVGDAVEKILADAFGAARFDRAVLREGFALADRMFAGRQDGYLGCDMPYHDLRHSLDTTLAAARIAAGARDEPYAVGPDEALAGILCALFHDIGYLRRTSEAALCGPQLTNGHEARGIAFAAAWLRTTSLARHADFAPAIGVTELGIDVDALLAGRGPVFATVARMLGAADLLVQVADPVYLERCYYHLYPELVLAGGDRAQVANGRVEFFYRDALDLVRQTGTFYEKTFRPRLERDFGPVVPALARHFGGADPYAPAVTKNLDRQARVAADGAAAIIGAEPTTTTVNLAAVYHAPRPSAA